MYDKIARASIEHIIPKNKANLSNYILDIYVGYNYSFMP